MRSILCFFLLLLCSTYVSSAQEYTFNQGRTSQTVEFELINNLIVFPLTVNGTELTFILDTGVGSPVIFNMTSSDSLHFRNIEVVKLRGLGEGEPVEAVRSKGNTLVFGDIVGKNQDLFIIYNEKLDLSGKLGVSVNGIIGYDILKNFVVSINYLNRKLTFTNPEDYPYKKCKSCETFDLHFYKKKPFINAEIENLDNSIVPVQLLIDSGGTDSIWLFEDIEKNVAIPENSFEDFIGEGISGGIFGMRSKLNAFKLKRFLIPKPNVAYLDSVSSAYAKGLSTRNGSLGGNILKRFKVVLDYPNKKMTLKKNRNFSEPFSYNMSGIELIHAGTTLVKELNSTRFNLENETSVSNSSTITLNYMYSFNLKPTYKIAYVRKDSPSDKCGLMVGDLLVKVNGKYAYNYQLKDIVEKFYGSEENWVRLTVERNGRELDYSFKLKNLLEMF
ncbi:aspartyl protease family protein [Urechidicola vernalis]|uniref:Aspartyl protease family protein n=1 Tax=Urechidicola vernalis TaxID=3075600 RepID=A0ABU2Y6R4_9FLAO|nr:aspartyl protease family protein [Urechidicola sp. P050]MDT0553897.1 aspartyl protease family protein [Urechidicola sp. P050]